MRTLREKYMAEIEIGENVYKADFNILEKYQGFSSEICEILRLSLLTLAVYGFIITNMVFKLQGETSRMLKYFRQYETEFISGGLILLAAALFSLTHKYFSTDCMTHHIRRLRVQKNAKDLIAIAHKKNLDHSTSAKKLYDEKDLRKLDNEDLNDDQLLSKIIRCTKIVETENHSYEKPSNVANGYYGAP